MRLLFAARRLFSFNYRVSARLQFLARFRCSQKVKKKVVVSLAYYVTLCAFDNICHCDIELLLTAYQG